MAGLTIDQLIKIIIGVLVVVFVVIGIYLIFKTYILDFFKNMLGGNSTESFLCFLR